MKYATALLLLILNFNFAWCQDTTAFTQQEVIYGRKDGMALTMMVLKPQKGNGRGIINLLSGNWKSSFNGMNAYIDISKLYINNGYTVFVVVHGSQPRYAIPDAVADVKRAVQFIRYNAAGYGISPEYIGIRGSSSGGHLALMAGLADDQPDAKAKDPVSRVSGKVQAVACFFPPTDFLNWGAVNVNPSAQKQLLQALGVLGAFTFAEWDSTKKVYTIIEDAAKITTMAKSVSPAQLVTPDDAPVFIYHGDADRTVPLQQSQLLKQKMEAAKLPVMLKVKQGGGHGWKDISTEEKEFIGWFDTYLKVKR